MQDGYDQTLSGLLRKRAELAGEAETRRKALDETLAALDAVDTVIRVFNPNIGPDELPASRSAPLHAAVTSDIRRFLIDMMRNSIGPVRTLQATDALLESRGIDRRDRVLTTLFRKRVTDAFGRMRKAGIAEGRKYGSGSEMEWRLIRH